MNDTLRLNIGQGMMPIDGYEGVDSQPYAGVATVARVPPLPYGDASVADIYSGHFIEHLPPWDIAPFLDECRRVLVVGGTLTIVCPDADKARLLVESGSITPETYALMVGGAKYDDMPHWILWNTRRLRQAIERAGFALNDAYEFRSDTRVYDRRAPAQCAVQAVRV